MHRSSVVKLLSVLALALHYAIAVIPITMRWDDDVVAARTRQATTARPRLRGGKRFGVPNPFDPTPPPRPVKLLHVKGDKPGSIKSHPINLELNPSFRDEALPGTPPSKKFLSQASFQHFLNQRDKELAAQRERDQKSAPKPPPRQHISEAQHTLEASKAASHSSAESLARKSTETAQKLSDKTRKHAKKLGIAMGLGTKRPEDPFRDQGSKARGQGRDGSKG